MFVNNKLRFSSNIPDGVLVRLPGLWICFMGMHFTKLHLWVVYSVRMGIHYIFVTVEDMNGRKITTRKSYFIVLHVEILCLKNGIVCPALDALLNKIT